MNKLSYHFHSTHAIQRNSSQPYISSLSRYMSGMFGWKMCFHFIYKTGNIGVIRGILLGRSLNRRSAVSALYYRDAGVLVRGGELATFPSITLIKSRTTWTAARSQNIPLPAPTTFHSTEIGEQNQWQVYAIKFSYFFPSPAYHSKYALNLKID